MEKVTGMDYVGVWEFFRQRIAWAAGFATLCLAAGIAVVSVGAPLSDKSEARRSYDAARRLEADARVVAVRTAAWIRGKVVELEAGMEFEGDSPYGIDTLQTYRAMVEDKAHAIQELEGSTGALERAASQLRGLRVGVASQSALDGLVKKLEARGKCARRIASLLKGDWASEGVKQFAADVDELQGAWAPDWPSRWDDAVGQWDFVWGLVMTLAALAASTGFIALWTVADGIGESWQETWWWRSLCGVGVIGVWFLGGAHLALLANKAWLGTGGWGLGTFTALGVYSVCWTVVAPWLRDALGARSSPFLVLVYCAGLTGFVAWFNVEAARALPFA